MVLMMRTIKITLLALVLLGALSENSLGQQNRLQYADKQFELANFQLAASEYAKLFETSPDYLVAKKTALSLDEMYSYAESYEWWKKTVEFEGASKEDYESLIRSGFRSVKEYDAAQDLQGSGYTLEDFEEFSKSGYIESSPFRIYSLQAMDELNTNASDYSISLTNGSRFFASNRGDGVQATKSGLRFDVKGSKFNRNYFKSDGRKYYGIYRQDENGEVKSVSVAGFELYHLSDPQLLSNGKLIFTATPNKLKSRDEVIYPGLFYGTYNAQANEVTDVKPFSFNQTNAYGVISPRIDEQQGRLYFASNISGGQGGYDLYYVTLDSEMNVSEPVNLGPTINSKSNERDAVRVGDNLIFASDRKGGFGGLDVYLAKIKGEDFETPVNMGQPINSVGDDFGFSVPEENKGYLSSDRVGGLGFDDLYAVTWSDRNLKITVIDLEGNSLKEGTNLQLTGDGKETNITKVSEEEILNLTRKGNAYTFTADRPGYFTKNETVTLAKNQEEVTLVMVPIPYELEVYQAIIYYDFDKDFLRELSKEKLDEIKNYMSKHPELNLVIESHTDSRASDKYNQRLSERRAKVVTKYLEEHGISADRVSSAWFSENRLVNDCGDGVPCPAPAHQLNRRSELKLIAFPDRSKHYDLPSGSTGADFKTIESAKSWFTKE
ncbi:hypothetical protein AO498_10175 [Algoriphagus sanaruensis]|uniref:OmpA-like domain-containing protein n=2 Tax=Algoriphagus sanaruensis TaxID=1727163 RepID=A0A142ENT8_9BACT|nr:hypothetical protein AO498_10175 [Algoriphagus sanaruensis]